MVNSNKYARFMPNVKFTVPDELIDSFKNLLIEMGIKRTSVAKYKQLDSIYVAKNMFFYYDDARDIFIGYDDNIDYLIKKTKASIYEVIPEFIPNGMRYNKELDILEPDVVSATTDYIKNIDIKEEDKQILDELKKSGKSYLEIIDIIKNTNTFKKHKGGDGNDYYDLPKDSTQLQDLIDFKNMNGNIKDIFKACWRKGDKKGVDEIYDVEKIVYYSLREAGRVLKTKDYISIATRIIGKQNISEYENEN